MIKRLALLFCCILSVSAIAVSSSQAADTNYGDFWVGGQVMGVFTPNRNVDVTFGGLGYTIDNLKTDPAIGAGAIIGYNFCMPNRQPWERYFGVALDFQWNQFKQTFDNFGANGNQFALALLARAQYPFMGDDRFTRGRIVPFIMAGPAVVWTNSEFSDFGIGSKTSTDVGVVAEVGVEFFIIPQLSIGPSFRYRHVWGPTYDFWGAKVDSNLNQFMVLGRLAYHF